jgi:hypothetical protein
LKVSAAGALRVFPSLELVFPMEDLGGGVDDLQVKESDTEIRIGLAADDELAKAALTVKGWGETRPVAPNEQPDGTEGRQRNRRVEVVGRQAPSVRGRRPRATAVTASSP